MKSKHIFIFISFIIAIVFSFRIFLSMIILTCIQKSTSVFLQSLGKPVMAMGLSLLRDFVLSIPLAIVLPMFFGVEGALLSVPIADIVTTVAVVLMSINVVKELDSKINSGEDDAKEAQVA
jgi:Na+-driven multidrug efflux pump